jgi:hypothetical protein
MTARHWYLHGVNTSLPVTRLVKTPMVSDGFVNYKYPAPVSLLISLTHTPRSLLISHTSIKYPFFHFFQMILDLIFYPTDEENYGA